jgi:hypothetical protein
MRAEARSCRLPEVPVGGGPAGYALFDGHGRNESNSIPGTVIARIEKARAEKKIDDRLQALAGMGKTLSLPEIPAAVKAAEDLKSLREWVTFTEATKTR